MRALNESQRQALDLDQHLLVEAGPGSGKTTVLVERYVQTLQRNDFNPEQIVAITFTEEAAYQIRRRIDETIQQRLASSQSFISSDWIQARLRMPNAPITTLHGFCLSLIREFPGDAGVESGFSIPSPAEQNLLLAQSVSKTLEELSRQFHPALATLLDHLSGSLLEPLFREMNRKFRVSQIAEKAEEWDLLMETWRVETISQLRRLPEWEELDGLLESIPEDLREGEDSVARRCRHQRTLLQTRKELSWAQFFQEFQESLSARATPTVRWKESGFHRPLKRLWGNLNRAFRQWPLELPAVSEAAENEFRQTLEALHTVHTIVANRYQERKRAENLLDFEDLLLRAGQLVRKVSVRDRLRKRFKYFLVDEFQDTNQLEWSLLKPLLGPENNLFVVGDAKQSIYRFRDADVSVFNQVARWVDANGKRLGMSENYRSHPQIVEFCNTLSESIFEGHLEYEARHQELQPMLGSEELQCQTDVQPVETFFYDKIDSTEPEVVCSWIERLVQAEGFQHSDIAVLFRARTRLFEYEDSLRKSGIPYRTVAGYGFYRRQEIYDLANLLNFLARGDEVALIGVLRSPFFNLSDEDLLQLSQLPGEDLWGRLLGAGKHSNRGVMSEPSATQLKYAARILQRWQTELEKGPPIALFLSHAIQESGYAAIVSDVPAGDQIVANLLKLLDQIRDFGGRRRRSSREVARYLQGLIEIDSEEEEAVTSETVQDAVELHTIHGAKGLEFPVVILPGLGRDLSRLFRESFYSHNLQVGQQTKLYLSIQPQSPSDGYQPLEHPHHFLLKQLNHYRQIAEEKRLLYVAATRARSRLVVIGKRSSRLTYGNWVEEAVGECYQAEIPSSSVARSGPKRLHSEASFKSFGTFNRLSSWKSESSQAPVWTPTDLTLHHLCPRKYYLSRLEHIPEQIPFSNRLESSIGSAVHQLLEQVDYSRFSTEEGLFENSWLQNQLDLWESGNTHLSAQQRWQVRERVIRHLENIRYLDFFQELASAKQVFSEKAFTIQEGGTCVQGVIDTLFESQERWNVVDFKTTALDASGGGLGAQSLDYQRQLDIYLWAAAKLLGVTQLRGYLVFTAASKVFSFDYDFNSKARLEEALKDLPGRQSLDRFPVTSDQNRCSTCGFFERSLCKGAEPKQIWLW